MEIFAKLFDDSAIEGYWEAELEGLRGVVAMSESEDALLVLVEDQGLLGWVWIFYHLCERDNVFIIE